MSRHVLLMSTALLFSLVPRACADNWQWRRIAWEGTSLNGMAAPNDSAHVLYVTIDGFSNVELSRDSLGVYKSSDGGTTWVQAAMHPSPGFVTIDPRQGATVYCGSSALIFDPWPWFPEGYPHRSRDAGEHWEPLDVPAVLLAPSCWRDGLLFAIGRAQWTWSLRRSDDDGVTWQYLCGTEGPRLADRVVFHSSDSTVVYAGHVELCDRGLGRSNDEGLTWEIILQGTICAFDQDPFDSDHLVAMILAEPPNAGSWAETFDSGTTWNLRAMPDAIWKVSQVLFDQSQAGVIYLAGVQAGWNQNLGVYRSTDGGLTWQSMNDGFPPGTHTWQLLKTSGHASRLLAARRDGLWWWTDQQAGEWADRRAAFRLEGVGPCPFRGRLSGRLVLAHAEYVSAGVYSLDGRVIRTLVDSPLSAGSHALTWDGLSEWGVRVGPGAVVLRVRAGEAVRAEPLVNLP